MALIGHLEYVVSNSNNFIFVLTSRTIQLLLCDTIIASKNSEITIYKSGKRMVSNIYHTIYTATLAMSKTRNL